METVKRSALVPYSAQKMFALVADIESYPQFLPWCDGARILSEQGETVVAELQVGYSGIRQAFTTANTNQAPNTILMNLADGDGPFRELSGAWTFEDLGQGSKVALQLDFSFDNFLFRKTFGPVFAKIANSQIDAFVSRAQALYGETDSHDSEP